MLCFTDGIPTIIDLLRIDNENIQAVTLAVLCNMTENPPVCEALSAVDAGSILIRLLESPDCDVQSRSAVVLADLASLESMRQLIRETGGIASLVRLLESSFEDVLIHAVDALRVVCAGGHDAQTDVGQSGAIPPMVEFLSVTSGMYACNGTYQCVCLSVCMYACNGTYHICMNLCM